MTYGTVNVDSVVNSDGVTSGGLYGFKNRIINGDMRIAQRTTSAVTADGAYPVDRWGIFYSNDGAYTAQQDSSAPAGFSYSTKLSVTTADSSLAAGQYTQYRQAIEGFNTADFAWGTSGAKSVTLSFWIKSSLTGTFAASMRNGAGDRSYVFTYAISSANTWEQKTVTIAGDTSGTWLTANNVGLYLTFDIGTGSQYQTTANSWAAGNYWSTSSSVPVIGTLNATWYITGVQLEKGSTATSFDYRPYGTELALCQRYCIRYGGTTVYERVALAVASSGTNFALDIALPTEMRTVPSLSYSNLSHWAYGDIGTGGNTSPTAIALQSVGTSTKVASIECTVSSGLTAYRTGQLNANNTTSASLVLSAEL